MHKRIKFLALGTLVLVGCSSDDNVTIKVQVENVPAMATTLRVQASLNGLHSHPTTSLHAS